MAVQSGCPSISVFERHPQYQCFQIHAFTYYSRTIGVFYGEFVYFDVFSDYFKMDLISLPDGVNIEVLSQEESTEKSPLPLTNW